MRWFEWECTSYLLASASCFLGGGVQDPRCSCAALLPASVADRSSEAWNSPAYYWRSYFLAVAGFDSHTSRKTLSVVRLVSSSSCAHFTGSRSATEYCGPV